MFQTFPAAGLLAIGLAMTACYDPELRDCVVSCASADDCATGQTCGGDGLCASPDVAGSCGDGDSTTSESPADDRPDASPPSEPDADDGDGGDGGDGGDQPGDPAPPIQTTTARVIVSGKGRVTSASYEIDCVGESPNQPAECAFDVPVNARLVLLAVDVHHQWTFVGWTSSSCAAQGVECDMVVPADGAIIAVTFERRE